MVGLHEGLAGTFLKYNILYNLITLTFYFLHYGFNFTKESQDPLEKVQTHVRSPVLKKKYSASNPRRETINIITPNLEMSQQNENTSPLLRRSP